MLFVLSLSVLAWIAMFPGETVKSDPGDSATTETLLRGGLNPWTAEPTRLKAAAHEAQCPEESQLLRKYILTSK